MILMICPKGDTLHQFQWISWWFPTFWTKSFTHPALFLFWVRPPHLQTCHPEVIWGHKVCSPCSRALLEVLILGTLKDSNKKNLGCVWFFWWNYHLGGVVVSCWWLVDLERFYLGSGPPQNPRMQSWRIPEAWTCKPSSWWLIGILVGGHTQVIGWIRQSKEVWTNQGDTNARFGKRPWYQSEAALHPQPTRVNCVKPEVFFSPQKKVSVCFFPYQSWTIKKKGCQKATPWQDGPWPYHFASPSKNRLWSTSLWDDKSYPDVELRRDI